MLIIAIIISLCNFQKPTIISFCKEEVQNFNQTYKDRTAGSVGENSTANYIMEKLEEFNINPFFDNYIQKFKVNNQSSQNVIGFVDNNSPYYVIIGAHYDNVFVENKSFGINDNASGVLTNLNLTSLLRDANLNYNIIFAFFGAEEIGLKGSEYFLNSLQKKILDNIILYINLDSIGAGDNLYYYHYDLKTIYGNYIDNFAKNFEITKLGKDKLYSNTSAFGINYNHIGLNSDNASFLKKGINSLTFFAGNLSATGFGFFETEGQDKIMHNSDNIQTIEEVFGEKFYSNMENVNNFVYNLMISKDFVSNMLEREINPTLLSLWFLKLIGILLIICLALITFFLYICKKKRKTL